MADERNSRPDDPLTRTLRLEDGGEFREDVLAAVRAAVQPTLVVMTGARVGTRTRVSGTMLVGRDPEADLVLPDAGVSFRHARVEDRGDTWAVVDLASTNGTQVNGARVTDAAIGAGDRLTFGATLVRFEVHDEADQQFAQVVERMLHVDELSGLWVRRRFDDELRTTLEAHRVKREPLGLLVMDLDGVKQVNDTHGHLFGAYVIGEAGHLIGRVLGERGFASRFGGDEYIAAVPGADTERTAGIGEEIRSAIAAHRFEREGKPLAVGISVGVASFPESAADAEALFRVADEALYRAKREGKNRVARSGKQS